MSAGAPWSVKGIDPKAREVAKDLARRSGMTLGEWLNRVILEDDVPDEVTSEHQFGDRNLRTFAEGARPRPLADPEFSRVAQALDRLTDRLEAAETRTSLAIGGIEHSVREALARIDAAEREQHAVVARVETLALDRIARIDAESGPRSPEALRMMAPPAAAQDAEDVAEVVLERLGDRLARAEARTAAALDGLKSSLGVLDRRLGAVERVGAATGDGRFEAMAQALSEQVETLRAEVAGKLTAMGDGAIDARVAELAEQVRAAERRSAKAVEEIGRQVLSMAEAVGRKLGEVDQRGADAIDQVGGEVARIASAVELRLARGEQAQAEAFDRFSAELARLGERIAQGPAATPEAAVPTVEDLVAEALPDDAATHENVATFAPLAELDAEPGAEPVPSPEVEPEPIAVAAFAAPEVDGLPPPPEPETEEALMAAAAAAAAEAAEEAPATAAPDTALQTIEDILRTLSAAEAPPAEAEPPTAALGPEVMARAEVEPEAVGETITPPWRRLDLDVPETKIPETFQPLAEHPADDDLFEPAAGQTELSTREVIERARAAARAAREAQPETMAAAGARAETLQSRTRMSGAGRFFTGFGAKTKRAPRHSTLQTALMVAGGAAFMTVGAAGVVLMQSKPGEVPQPTEMSAPRAAMALAPTSLTAPAAAPADLQAPAPVFEKVKADVEAGAPGALAQLKALAEANHAQAQLYLAQLYDGGEAGLPQDPVEARRLTQAAADNGDVKAMHNLGVYLFRGEGGAQDLPQAANWFSRAAQAGVVESQYNLGLLYRSGSGVPKDLAQARHWFSEAASRGDDEAERALAALDPALAAPKALKEKPQREARQAPPSAKSHHAATKTPASLAGASMNVRQMQLMLTRQGYYDGPLDGRASVAYDRALAEYRRAQDGASIHVSQR